MSRRKPRGLRPDEKDLWERFAKTTTPMDRPKPVRRSDVVEPAQKPVPPAPPEPIPKFTIGQKSAWKDAGHVLRPDVETHFSGQPLRMDRRTFDRMKRGKAAPDGRIDLHGKTADAARSALIAYLLSAHSQGKRLILVITGKGREAEDDGPIPARRGVIRSNLPHWLSTPPLSSVVLQTTPAHRRHGGSGAFYVYLRRSG